jgi:hypothetical protein
LERKSEEEPTQIMKEITVDRAKPKEIEVIMKPKAANKEEIQESNETDKEREKRIIEEFFNHCKDCAKEENMKKAEAVKQTIIKLSKEPKPPTSNRKLNLLK